MELSFYLLMCFLFVCSPADPNLDWAYLSSGQSRGLPELLENRCLANSESVLKILCNNIKYGGFVQRLIGACSFFYIAFARLPECDADYFISVTVHLEIVY